MFGIRSWWSQHRLGILDKLKWILDPKNRDKAAKSLAASINMMEMAAPYVKALTDRMTNTWDDALLAAAMRIGIKIEDAFNEPDWHRKVGLLQDLAGEALREKIKALVPTFDHGLEIAGTVVTTAEEVDALSHNAFHAPVILAVNALRAAGEIISAFHPVETPAVDPPPVPE